MFITLPSFNTLSSPILFLEIRHIRHKKIVMQCDPIQGKTWKYLDFFVAFCHRDEVVFKTSIIFLIPNMSYFIKKKFQLETQLGKHGCHQISTFPFNTVHSTYVRMLNSRPYSMYEYSLASSWTGGIVGNNFHNVCTKWLFLATRMKGIILGWLL